jgi:ABC-type polysaccharide transport system permease subunit
MKKNLYAMEHMGVWKIIFISKMPPGRISVGIIWAYTERYDGTESKNCFGQVLVNDLHVKHAAVITDLALGVARIIQIIINQSTGQFDFETALLYSDFDVEIYINVPEGLVWYMLDVHNRVINPSTHKLSLKKINYLSREWYRLLEAVQGSYGWM